MDNLEELASAWKQRSADGDHTEATRQLWANARQELLDTLTYTDGYTERMETTREALIAVLRVECQNQDRHRGRPTKVDGPLDWIASLGMAYAEAAAQAQSKESLGLCRSLMKLAALCIRAIEVQGSISD